MMIRILKFFSTVALGIALQTAAYAEIVDTQVQTNQDNLKKIEQNQAQQGLVDRFLAKLGASDEIDVSKGIDWGILPGPFVNPQQGFGVGIAAVGVYAPYDWVKGTPYSTVSVKAFGSSTGSYGVGFENRAYLKQDKLRILADVWLTHTPKYYWGIGKANAENDHNKSEYNAAILQITPQISYQFLPYTYFNLGWDFNSYTQLTIKNNALTQNQLKNQRISGYSVALEYDSRDFEPNSYKGMLLSLKYTNYLKSLGSSHNFQNFKFNYRQYYQINERNILAWDVFGQKVEGNIPWFAYAELGSDHRMRGYYAGQYRDRSLFTAQLELRHQFNRYHGVVAWAGFGNVSHHSKDLFRTGVLPTYGAGYRFAFKPRINVRFDFGLGKRTTGFYFNINEAF